MNYILPKSIIRTIILIFACLIIFSGCSNNLTIKGNYPRPLVKSLPFNVGAVFDENFTTYKYSEESKDRSNWKINLGQAQTKLFTTILPAMFNKMDLLDTVGNNAAGDIDLVIVPSVTDFQYNVPDETNISMFEVWLKYNIKVYEPSGELIADWIMTAYGKTPSYFIQTDDSALNLTINVALRDAGANLSLTFVRVPEIRAWLQKQQLKASENLTN